MIYYTTTCYGLAPVAQSVVAELHSSGCEFETRLGQHFFSINTIYYDKHQSSFTNRLIVYLEKQIVAWKVCGVEYWCGKAHAISCYDLPVLHPSTCPKYKHNRSYSIAYLLC